MEAFARTYMQCNPLYLNDQYARASGFAGLVASPQMVFNVVLSLGVQNDSEKAMANLGYYDAQYLRPVHAMDTDSLADQGHRPQGARRRQAGHRHHPHAGHQPERRSGAAVREEDHGRRAGRPSANHARCRRSTVMPAFPWVDEAEVFCRTFRQPLPAGLTGPNSYFEDFSVGEIIVHANGRTITDEQLPLTYAVGNTHPLHFDRVFSSGLSGKMSGDPIVYGGWSFAWLEGLASRDVSENSVWELGFTEGYHTQPSIAGDTVAALSRVLAVEEAPGALAATVRRRHVSADRRQERQCCQGLCRIWRGLVHQGKRQESDGQGEDRCEDF
jgi:2-methylfumaryl-CoA hydratase